MRLDLPPIELENAEILRAGVLRSGSLGLEEGLIAEPGAPAVDATGYILMPGAIDLGGQVSSASNDDADLFDFARRAADAGTTTLFVGLKYDARTPCDLLERLGSLAKVSTAVGIDLRPRIEIEVTDLAAHAAVASVLRNTPDAFVLLQHADRSDRARWASDGIGPLTRSVSCLAQSLESLGLPYGSEGDVDAETREWMSMLGARMVVRPGGRPAAASARAMVEPVILSAFDLLTGGSQRAAVQSALLGEGMCDALATFGAPDAGLRTVHGLVSGGTPLGHAWALISAAPAGLMRLSDRGGLVPGTRADVVVLDAKTQTVAATICAGRLVYANAGFLARLAPVFEVDGLAAE